GSAPATGSSAENGDRYRTRNLAIVVLLSAGPGTSYHAGIERGRPAARLGRAEHLAVEYHDVEQVQRYRLEAGRAERREDLPRHELHRRTDENRPHLARQAAGTGDVEDRGRA